MPRHTTVACGGAEIRYVFVGIGSFQDHVEYHDGSLQSRRSRQDTRGEKLTLTLINNC